MREAIEALLRAVDRFFNAHSVSDRHDAECLLGAAAAAVRAELAREPVELSDERFDEMAANIYASLTEVHNDYDISLIADGLRAVARAARGESK